MITADIENHWMCKGCCLLQGIVQSESAWGRGRGDKDAAESKRVQHAPAISLGTKRDSNAHQLPGGGGGGRRRRLQSARWGPGRRG